MSTDSKSNPLTIDDPQYKEALRSVKETLEQLKGCPDEERKRMKSDIGQLNDMLEKITKGKVEIVIFGEISTGKSAIINALIGQEVTEVNVQGGWTTQVWKAEWGDAGYRVGGLESSEVILIDTPGINEVDGGDRADLAETTARRADLILFVTDSDLNETEYAALVELAALKKPMLFVFNKIDLYSAEDRAGLLKTLGDRIGDIIPVEHFVFTAADPREIEYVIEQPDGSEKVEWRKPDPDVIQLKTRILETLEKEGVGLIALNAALYAADKSDKIAALRVEMRNKQADQVIWTMAATKAMVVAFNPFGFFDILGGFAIDALMIVTLSKVYGLNFSMGQARELSKAIGKAAGVFALGELTSWGASAFKVFTVGLGSAIAAIPQGAATGFSSYIIGKAAKHYFEHGGSWGTGSAKSVVSDILETTDKDSVVNHLKDEIRKNLSWNRHAENE